MLCRLQLGDLDSQLARYGKPFLIALEELSVHLASLLAGFVEIMYVR